MQSFRHHLPTWGQLARSTAWTLNLYHKTTVQSTMTGSKYISLTQGKVE